MFEVIVVDTPTLGDRSYLVHDGTTAFVVDPQRDIDRVLDVAAERGVRVEHILETHVHNDYVTGGYGLARETGALYWVNADDPVGFEGSSRISDGQRVVVSPSLTIRALATPGHTHTHLAFLLEHQGEVVAVFSGGSLLYGSTGRPDLLGPDHTERLVHDQWSTAQRLASLVPAAAALYPTHGFGSFCSASQSDVSASTIGAERASNPVLLLSEAAWVQDVLSGLDAWPAFYAHMAPANLGGPAATDPTPPPFIAPPELQRRAQFGEWVVDLRHRKAFCEAHLAGTIAIGLDGSFATYMGWLVPWGAPVTLLGETANDIAMAQRELSRIGIDRPAAAATGGPDESADRTDRWHCPGPPSPTWTRCRNSAGSRWSTSGASSNGHREPCPALSISRCTSWQTVSASCRPASFGCTARAGTAPPLRPHSCFGPGGSASQPSTTRWMRPRRPRFPYELASRGPTGGGIRGCARRRSALRHRRWRVRRDPSGQSAQERRRRSDAGRPAQLPPLPAAELPGGDRVTCPG